MDASLTLTRFGARHHRASRHAWPLTVQAAGLNMPSAIFVYQMGDKEMADRFKCVATVSDLNELPRHQARASTRSHQSPFYLRAQADLVLRSAAEADSVWQVLQQEALDLVADFNSSLKLAGVEFATITDTIQNQLFSPQAGQALVSLFAGTPNRIKPGVGLQVLNPTTGLWYTILNIGPLGQEQWAMDAGDATVLPDTPPIFAGTNCRVTPGVGVEIQNDTTKLWYPLTNAGAKDQEQWGMADGEPDQV